MRGYKELNLRALKMLRIGGRDAGDLLLLAPCGDGGVHWRGAGGCGGRGAAGAGAGDARRRAGPSGDSDAAGDELSEVPDLPGGVGRLFVSGWEIRGGGR